ncbi:MAG: LamG domain-containing protein, partial [Nanoarchaeota archaeon]|nr:LamG domain-containing protein [Nanoarchaeota archaeon]
MHKKSIGGRSYYYTSYRDSEGKVRSKYLGTSAIESSEKEKDFLKGNGFEWCRLIIPTTILAFIGLILLGFSFTGFFFLQEGSIVKFEINETWNLSDGFARISQDTYLYDIMDLPSLVVENYIVINLTNYNVTEGDVYVDLIINETVVDSAHIYYNLGIEEVIEETIIINETTEEVVVEEIIQPLETYPGDLILNISGSYQVEYVNVNPKIPYDNNTLECENGSTSADVTKIYYLWYVNNNYLGIEKNDSTLSPGNFTPGDNIDCGIVPQNQSNLVAYWSFDEGSGNYSVDFINNNSAYMYNAQWTTGKHFKAITTGTNSYLNITNPRNLNTSREFTYEVWVKPIATGGTIYQYGSFEIGTIAGNKAYISLRKHGESAATALTSNHTVNTSIWTHIAFTYNQTNLSVYINGVLDNVTNYTGELLLGESGNVNIGVKYPAPSNYFQGDIDELAIYNVSLSSEVIYDHYVNGIQKNSRNFTLEVTTTQDHFKNGTCTQVNCIKGGNLTLGNQTSNSYYARGNFTSQIFDRPNWKGSAELSWSNNSVSNGNISLMLRTGVYGDNNNIIWSEYFGPDPSIVTNDPYMVLALDFRGRYANTTKNLINQGTVQLLGNQLTPIGKHGSGLRVYPTERMNVSDFTALRLANAKNHTIELWIKPNNVNKVAILDKGTIYRLSTNLSGNLYYETTKDSVYYNLTSNSILSTGVWTHIAITENSLNQTKLFINGILNANTTMPGSLMNTASNLGIGYSNGLNASNGTFDSIVIYNRTLTAEEVWLHARDRFTNSSGPQNIGYMNRLFQYKIFLGTRNNQVTPQIYDISVRLINYTTYINNRQPNNVTLTSPTSGFIATNTSLFFDWSNTTDIDNDTVYYEYILSRNNIDLSTSLIVAIGVNNFSETDYSDDNQSLFIEHFNSKDEMINQSWTSNAWNRIKPYGKFGSGFHLLDGVYLTKTSSTSNQYLNRQKGSLEFWVKPSWSGTDSGSNYFFDSLGNQFEMNRTNSLLKYRFGSLSKSNQTLTYNISSWNAGEWHHIAVSWDVSNFNHTFLIIDGQEVNRTQVQKTQLSFGNTFYLGSDSDSGNTFNGVMDELRSSYKERVSYNNLTKSSFNITNISLFNDGVAYWFVRSVNYKANRLESEKIYSDWQYLPITFDTMAPVISYTENPIKVLSDINTSINLTIGETGNCSYRQYNQTYWTNFSSGNPPYHAFNVSLTKFGNHTYYINCIDQGGRKDNISLSFYVFNSSRSTPTINVTTATFIANEYQEIYLYSSGTIIGKVGLKTLNNVTGKIYLVKNSYNPENNTFKGMGKTVLVFHTYFLDEHLMHNVSGNVSLSLTGDDFGNIIEGTEDLYFYNQTNKSWMAYPHNNPILRTTGRSIKFNTTKLGSFVIVGTPLRLASTTTTTTSSAEGALSDDDDEII